MEAAAKELLTSSAIGAALALVLLMLFWLIRAVVKNSNDQSRVLIENSTKQSDAVIKGMGELVEASRTLRDNCLACRTDSLRSIRDAEKALTEATWAARDRTFADCKDLIGAAVKTLQDALTGAAQDIREGIEATEHAKLKERAAKLEDQVEELSRPHDIGAVPHPVRG